MALALVLTVTVGAAWVLYYRHFTARYAQRFMGSGVAVASATPPGKVPIQRYEAHQTAFAPGWPALRARLSFVPLYVFKYVGAGLLTLALIAAWQRTRAPDPLDEERIVALGVALAVVVAFVAGQLTSVDLRYYLVAASLCVPIGAAVAARSGSRGETGLERVVNMLAALAIAEGCWYMARLLWHPLPRLVRGTW
jgi:hypothetical protein